MKKIAISQSNYIPWKGYFDLINSVDLFIILDSVQYTRGDWRNRNRIKTPNGPQWLTIPVNSHGNNLQAINRTEVVDHDWRDKHWETLKRFYSKAPFFKKFSERFHVLYEENEVNLSSINRKFINCICDILKINTEIVGDDTFSPGEGKNERLLFLCKQAEATHYISGPKAKAYLDEKIFSNEGIKVSYFNYEGYREYSQLYPPFVHEVSVLDLIFSTGEKARSYMLT